MPAVIGEQLGNFRIASLLGKGGMGEVYLGEHVGVGTRVAIKMLLPHVSANQDLVARFFNEAIAVGKIQHAGTGKIFDSGWHGERAYLVMEFLPGETLAARLRRTGRLSLAQVGELGKQIAGVLEAVHKAGITHRDLKPDNIFIVPDDELASGERIKIVDFGIAKLSGVGGGVTATTASAMGTPAYMSPEQWKNAKNVDWRADAYSLGCLAFEMFAGRPVFYAETIGEACAKHLSEEPPRLASILAVPPALDTLIASLLEKAPEKRPASMREIASSFGAIAAAAPNDLATTQLSGQIAIGHLQPPAMGATQTTGAGFATQATQSPMQPNANAPTVRAELPQMTPPPMQPSAAPIAPPPLTSTTLGAASAQVVAPPRRGVPLWIVLGLGAALAGTLVVLVVVLATPDKKGKKRDEVADVVPLTPTDLPKPAGSGSGTGTGSGSGTLERQKPLAPNPPPSPPRPQLEPKGVMIIESQPTGASVYLDGVFVSKTPVRRDVPLGPHKLHVVGPKGREGRKEFVSEEAQPFRHKFDFTVKPSVGQAAPPPVVAVEPKEVPFSLTPQEIVGKIDEVAGDEIARCKNIHGTRIPVMLLVAVGETGKISVLQDISPQRTDRSQCIRAEVAKVTFPRSKRGGTGRPTY